MKLYFSPGACSFSPHIVLYELGLPFDSEKVDLGAKKTKSGADYRAINPKGAVPALQLDDGQVLTEGAAIVQYLADRKPESKLAPAAGTMERYRLQEWLNYIASDFHKAFSPLFNLKMPDEGKQMAKDLIATRLDYFGKALEKRQYLMGDTFTVADAYLFTILTWAAGMKFDLSKWPAVQAYYERVGARPGVKAAQQAEALAKAA